MNYKDKQEIEDFIRQEIEENLELVEQRIESRRQMKEDEKRRAEEKTIRDAKDEKINFLSGKLEGYIFSEIIKMEKENIDIHELNFNKYFQYHLFLKLDEIDDNVCRVSGAVHHCL